MHIMYKVHLHTAHQGEMHKLSAFQLTLVIDDAVSSASALYMLQINEYLLHCMLSHYFLAFEL